MRGRRAAVALLAAAFVLAIPAPAFAERTIGLSSGTFEFTVEPGQSGKGEVIVSNDGDEPLKALVYVSDLEVSETGEQTFTTPDRQNVTSLATPATWFRIYMPTDSKSVGNTPYLELEPGEKIPIAFEFLPPAGTARATTTRSSSSRCSSSLKRPRARRSRCPGVSARAWRCV